MQSELGSVQRSRVLLVDGPAAKAEPQLAGGAPAGLHARVISSHLHVLLRSSLFVALGSCTAGAKTPVAVKSLLCCLTQVLVALISRLISSSKTFAPIPFRQNGRLAEVSLLAPLFPLAGRWWPASSGTTLVASFTEQPLVVVACGSSVNSPFGSLADFLHWLARIVLAVFLCEAVHAHPGRGGESRCSDSPP